MKSLNELEKIRAQAKDKMTVRLTEDETYRVVVGMATCGIAAGARAVLTTFVEEVATKKLPVKILQTGCIELCHLEPIVEVFDTVGNKTTYVLVTSDIVKEIVEKHLIGGHVVEQHTVAQHMQ